MKLGEWVGSIDLRAMVPSLLGAAAAFIALLLVVERLERVAEAQPISGTDRTWKAMTGTELRLSGLEEGPLVGVETSPGGGLTVRAQRAALVDGGPVQPLVWLTADQKGGDNKAKVEVSVVGKGGTVRLSRAGEEVAPQLLIRAENVKLRVDAEVTIGDSLTVPATQIFFDKKQLPATGANFSFIVPEGGFVAIEFPALPNGQPSGVVTTLGAAREEQQDMVLPVSEVGIYREGATAPDQAVCAADRRYAWAPFFRAALRPVPSGADCRLGPMTGRGFSIDAEWIGVSLAGQAWHTLQGKPIPSLWTEIEANPVLSVLIRLGLPTAVGWILGRIIWRRRRIASPQAEEPGARVPAKRPPSRSRGRRGGEPS
jgi:hypothetical protein